MRAGAYVPNGEAGPGVLSEVALEVEKVFQAAIVLPEATVRDESGDNLLSGGTLIFDPSRGGGPLAGVQAHRQARAFALVNTAFHVQRTLRFASTLLGRPLPHLLVRIGMHHDLGYWGGGHYRLPAVNYSELPEKGAIRPEGEVHLGSGRAFLSTPVPRYFHMPGHNAAIICHEVGHHVCRHTADFRLNGLLPPICQTNRKIALDEGTCDYIAAVMLGNPDIYGWHRGHVPTWQQTRRRLDPSWTMACFHGGRARDPHTDGTVWASTLWSAREAVQAAGFDPARFDAVVLRGLDRFGRQDRDERSREALRRRRHFSRLLECIVAEDDTLARPVLDAAARHGVFPGASNAELCDWARAGTARGSAL